MVLFQQVNVPFDFMKVGIDYSHALDGPFDRVIKVWVSSLGRRLGPQARSRKGTMRNASSSGSSLCALG